jgi:hypothetical protein
MRDFTDQATNVTSIVTHQVNLVTSMGEEVTSMATVTQDVTPKEKNVTLNTAEVNDVTSMGEEVTSMVTVTQDVTPREKIVTLNIVDMTRIRHFTHQAPGVSMSPITHHVNDVTSMGEDVTSQAAGVTSMPPITHHVNDVTSMGEDVTSMATVTQDVTDHVTSKAKIPLFIIISCLTLALIMLIILLIVIYKKRVVQSNTPPPTYIELCHITSSSTPSQIPSQIQQESLYMDVSELHVPTHDIYTRESEI